MNVPVVLHVIPTAAARGAQREARALATRLEVPGVRHHRLLSLFAGPRQVPVDLAIDHPGGERPAVGFDPRLVPRLRTVLRREAPTVVVAHGGDPLKYVVPAMIGRESGAKTSPAIMKIASRRRMRRRGFIAQHHTES